MPCIMRTGVRLRTGEFRASTTNKIQSVVAAAAATWAWWRLMTGIHSNMIFLGVALYPSQLRRLYGFDVDYSGYISFVLGFPPKPPPQKAAIYPRRSLSDYARIVAPSNMHRCLPTPHGSLVLLCLNMRRLWMNRLKDMNEPMPKSPTAV